MPDLPVIRIPRENDDYLPLTALKLDDADTTAIDVGWAPLGERPVATWSAHPGPKAPTDRGVYLVLIRATGGGVATEVGYVVVT